MKHVAESEAHSLDCLIYGIEYIIVVTWLGVTL